MYVNMNLKDGNGFQNLLPSTIIVVHFVLHAHTSPVDWYQDPPPPQNTS